MSIDEFETWKNYHCRIFGFASEADKDMTASWWPLVKDYSFEEIKAASTWLIMNRGGIFRTEHLGELRNRLSSMRQINKEKVDRERGAPSTLCKFCGNIGFVEVPHLKFIENFMGESRWVSQGNSYPTMTVLCSCLEGQRIINKESAYTTDNPGNKYKGAAGAPLQRMTLFNYNNHNPYWQMQLEKRQETLVHEEKAKLAANAAEQAQTLVSKLSKTFEAPHE